MENDPLNSAKNSGSNVKKWPSAFDLSPYISLTTSLPHISNTTGPVRNNDMHLPRAGSVGWQRYHRRPYRCWPYVPWLICHCFLRRSESNVATAFRISLFVESIGLLNRVGVSLECELSFHSGSRGIAVGPFREMSDDQLPLLPDPPSYAPSSRGKVPHLLLPQSKAVNGGAYADSMHIPKGYVIKNVFVL